MKNKMKLGFDNSHQRWGNITLEAEEKSKGFALEGKTEDEMLAEAVPFYKDLFSKCETTRVR